MVHPITDSSLRPLLIKWSLLHFCAACGEDRMEDCAKVEEQKIANLKSSVKSFVTNQSRVSSHPKQV